MEITDTIKEVAEMLLLPTWQTLLMVFWTGIFATLIGFPLGVLLNVTGENGLAPARVSNAVIGKIVNILRSFPFLILMILVFPLSRLTVGESIGTKAAIVPLSIAAAPYIARIIETALDEIDPQIVLAAKAMGSSTWQIIRKVMIPEAMPAIVAGFTLTIINIVGYSAMAGAIGGGGLGDLAIRYGYHRYRLDVMIGACLVIVAIVEVVQFLGTKIANRIMRGR